MNWGVISSNNYAADELNIVQSNALDRGRGRTAAAQDDQPTGPRTPPQAPRGWPPPRRVPLPHCLRRRLRLRGQLLLLQLPLFYSDSDAETAWPPFVIVFPPPPVHGAKPRVFPFKLFDIKSYLKAAFGLRLIGSIAPKQFTMIAASPKGVLHNQGTSRFVYNGCYLCVFTPPRGA